MKTTCLALFAFCVFLLQSFGLENNKASSPIQEAVDSFAASIEEAPETKEVLKAADSTKPSLTNIKLELKLPPAKKNQTITESSETIERTPDDIVSDYNFSKISKNISEELDPLSNQHQNHRWTEGEKLLIDTLLGFFIEATLTCIILFVVCTLLGITETASRIVACSFIIALIGAALGFTLRVDPTHPIRFILSFIVLISLIRLIIGVRRWPRIIQISLITRVISLAMIWVAYWGASALLGL